MQGTSAKRLLRKLSANQGWGRQTAILCCFLI